MTEEVKIEARVLARTNAKRPLTAAKEAAAGDEEDIAADVVAAATTTATAAEAATRGNGNALSAAPRITSHENVPKKDSRAHKSS